MGTEYIAYESLSVSTSAVGFTVATAANNDRAFVTVENAAVRFRDDGTNPSATVGHILEPGDVLELDSKGQIARARFISRDGATATLRSSFGTAG